MDPDLGRFGTLWAAAGTANTVFAVTPATLRMLSNANVAPIASEPIDSKPIIGERTAGAHSGA
jgi:hypothetical protein